MNNLDEAPIDNGTQVTWVSRGGVEMVGTVIGYVSDGLMIVMDENEKDHEIQATDLEVIED